MKGADAYAITTGPNSNGCLRNVFTIERADPDDGFEDDCVHYGQCFRLSLEPFADIRTKAYVHSESVTPLASGTSRPAPSWPRTRSPTTTSLAWSTRCTA